MCCIAKVMRDLVSGFLRIVTCQRKNRNTGSKFANNTPRKWTVLANRYIITLTFVCNDLILSLIRQLLSPNYIYILNSLDRCQRPPPTRFRDIVRLEVNVLHAHIGHMCRLGDKI